LTLHPEVGGCEAPLETMVSYYITTLWHNPEDNDLNVEAACCKTLCACSSSIFSCYF